MAELELRFGAPVFTADGREIGTLEAAIVDDDGFDPHSVVVRESDQFSRRPRAGAALCEATVLVPVEQVAEASPRRVVLKVNALAVRRLPPYLSYRYRPLDAFRVLGQVAALGTGTVAMANLEEVAGKRSDELEISEGENVMLGRSGRRLGHVREVVFDDGELAGVVMHPSGLFKHDVFVPVRFLDRSDDLALFVDLTESDLEQLAPPS